MASYASRKAPRAGGRSAHTASGGAGAWFAGDDEDTEMCAGAGAGAGANANYAFTETSASAGALMPKQSPFAGMGRASFMPTTTVGKPPTTSVKDMYNMFSANSGRRFDGNRVSMSGLPVKTTLCTRVGEASRKKENAHLFGGPLFMVGSGNNRVLENIAGFPSYRRTPIDSICELLNSVYTKLGADHSKKVVESLTFSARLESGDVKLPAAPFLLTGLNGFSNGGGDDPMILFKPSITNTWGKPDEAGYRSAAFAMYRIMNSGTLGELSAREVELVGGEVARVLSEVFLGQDKDKDNVAFMGIGADPQPRTLHKRRRGAASHDLAFFDEPSEDRMTIPAHIGGVVSCPDFWAPDTPAGTRVGFAFAPTCLGDAVKAGAVPATEMHELEDLFGAWLVLQPLLGVFKHKTGSSASTNERMYDAWMAEIIKEDLHDDAVFMGTEGKKRVSTLSHAKKRVIDAVEARIKTATGPGTDVSHLEALKEFLPIVFARCEAMGKVMARYWRVPVLVPTTFGSQFVIPRSVAVSLATREAVLRGSWHGKKLSDKAKTAIAGIKRKSLGAHYRINGLLMIAFGMDPVEATEVASVAPAEAKKAAADLWPGLLEDAIQDTQKANRLDVVAHVANARGHAVCVGRMVTSRVIAQSEDSFDDTLHRMQKIMSGAGRGVEPTVRILLNTRA